MQLGRLRMRGATAKAQGGGQERTETEAVHDFFDDEVALHEAFFVIPLAGEEALVDVRNLVQKHFAHERREADSNVRRLPIVTRLLVGTVKGVEADLMASVAVGDCCSPVVGPFA